MGNPREQINSAPPSLADFITEKFGNVKLNRRTLLVGGATTVAGLGLGLVIGCGSSEKKDGTPQGNGASGNNNVGEQSGSDVELQPGWELFTSDKLPYQIGIPPGWTQESYQPRENTDSFTFKEEDDSTSSLSIYAEPVEVSTAQEYAYQQQERHPDFDTVDAGFMVEGVGVYTVRGGNEAVGTTFERYVFVKDGLGWNIAISAKEDIYYDEKDVLLKDAVQTFRLR